MLLELEKYKKYTKCITLSFHLNTKVSCTYVDFLFYLFETGYNSFPFEIIFSGLLECFSKLRNLKTTRNLKFSLGSRNYFILHWQLDSRFQCLTSLLRITCILYFKVPFTVPSIWLSLRLEGALSFGLIRSLSVHFCLFYLEIALSLEFLFLTFQDFLKIAKSNSFQKHLLCWKYGLFQHSKSEDKVGAFIYHIQSEHEFSWNLYIFLSLDDTSVISEISTSFHALVSCSYFICKHKHYFSAADLTFLMFYVKIYSFFQRTILDSQHTLEFFYALITLDTEINLVKTYLVTAWKNNSW